jgi:hypothetical protein
MLLIRFVLFVPHLFLLIHITNILFHLPSRKTIPEHPLRQSATGPRSNILFLAVIRVIIAINGCVTVALRVHTSLRARSRLPQIPQLGARLRSRCRRRVLLVPALVADTAINIIAIGG